MELIDKNCICRGCLSTNENELQPIFDNIRTSEMFALCTSLEVHINDGLPETICTSCIFKCQSWFTFKELCSQSYLFFQKNYLSNIKISTKTVDDTSSITEICHIQNGTEYNTQISGIELANHECDNVHFTEIEQDYEDIQNNDVDYLDESIDFPLNQVAILKMDEKISKPEPKPKISEKKNCDKCGKTFRLQERLDAHINFVHLGIKAVTCSICNIGFTNMGNLKRHHSLQHTENRVKNYICKECGKAFMFSSSLAKHNRIHENIKSFVCDICGKGFIHKTGLFSHMLTHTTETPYPCNECGKKFKSQGMLKIHVTRHNNLMKTYVCSVCGKMFSTSGELTTHSRTHSGVRPYACDRCTKSFKTISQLYVHLRTHTGVRPFACDLCPLSFTSSEVLKHHRMIHTGEKPHQCQVCNRSFRQKCALRNHLKTHK